MINPNSINPASLPSLPLTDRRSLPELLCIYFAIDSQGAIQYIGRSVNLQRRWKAHQRCTELEAMGQVNVAWLEVSDATLLHAIEQALIKWFDPPLNREGQERIRRKAIAQATLRDEQSRKAQLAEDCNEVSALSGMRNKIRQFVEGRNISVYRFRKDTGIAVATAYRIFNCSRQIPSIAVLEKICCAYKVQPGELLEWVNPRKEQNND